MPSTTTAGAKICCKCGADVAGQKRMKDSAGQYWCVDCAKADEKKKKLIEGGICAECGQHFPRHDLNIVGDSAYCRPCLKIRARRETNTFGAAVKDMLSGSRDHEKRTTLIMLIIGALFVAAVVWKFVL
ncbi:MAG TPA: hypothetical protein VFB66_15735 [Tepidisphaeraceae bacterium]|jgi:NMD protein affecting ribosome stability and mRNA decay|nr:hypothetical protein [Tepidisphaeraceae bacterium]